MKVSTARRVVQANRRWLPNYSNAEIIQHSTCLTPTDSMISAASHRFWKTISVHYPTHSLHSPYTSHSWKLFPLRILRSGTRHCPISLSSYPVSITIHCVYWWYTFTSKSSISSDIKCWTNGLYHSVHQRNDTNLMNARNLGVVFGRSYLPHRWLYLC